MFQVPALKRDLEQARINQAYEIGWLCNESLFRWHWNKDFNVPCHETISWWYVNKDFALAMLRSTLLAARDPQIRPAVLRNALLVAQHGAGAKKDWEPAPLKIINILKVRNLSFSNGASNHENMSLYSSCRWRRFSRRHKKRPPGVVRLSGVPKNGSYLLSQLVGQYHRRW